MNVELRIWSNEYGSMNVEQWIWIWYQWISP